MAYTSARPRPNNHKNTFQDFSGRCGIRVEFLGGRGWSAKGSACASLRNQAGAGKGKSWLGNSQRMEGSILFNQANMA
jgi:hypothetical protein